jgi:hypothetical protein
LRDAANLWAALESKGGASARDSAWAHPDLAPTSADLDDPLGYVERFLAGGTSDAMDAALDAMLSEGLSEGLPEGGTGSRGGRDEQDPTQSPGESGDEGDAGKP